MEFFVENINLLVFLPLIMCGIIGFNALLSYKIDKGTLFTISIVSSFFCIIFSAAAFLYSLNNDTSVAANFPWLTLENVNFYLGTYVDKISSSFLAIFCVLSFVIQIFAYRSLSESSDFSRLLFYINLFALGLTGVFIAPNIFQSYLFCEVTGVASYLLINFDFSNRNESKAAIKSFIYNRIGDLTLLFCVLTILYYSVVYNQLTDQTALAYSNMNVVSASINSLMSEPLFIIFCSVLIFVIVMKFMQAFIYITFETKNKGSLSKIILFQNSLITLVGVFLLLRLNPFFFALGKDWIWALLFLAVMFVAMGVLNKLFIPFCKMLGWFEKYIVDSVINFIELIIRTASYLCCRFQTGNFQSYMIYSLVGLVMILGFVLLFYLLLVKV